MFINYLSISNTIPNDVLESLDTIKQRPFATGTPFDDGFFGFRLKDVNNELIDYLNTVFPLKITRGRYQFIYNHIRIHTDYGREYAINYILEPGGENVVTNIYDKNRRIIQSECILPFKWHSIQTSKPHSVNNINKDSVRIAISIAPANPNELDEFIKKYSISEKV